MDIDGVTLAREMPSKLEAVESLMELGLTEYEARCFVALTQLSEGTAKEVSRIADVPQSRVYDIADRLHRKGVVDVQESDPRRYRVLSVERAMDRLQQEYSESLEAAAERLQELESRSTPSRGVWEIAAQRDVVDRLLMHLEDAEEEVFLLVAEEGLLGGELLETLADAVDRDVTVYVEVPTEAARERFHDAVPDARVTVTDLHVRSTVLDECEPGRLALIDHETVVLSSLQEGLVPDEHEETGLWGTGVGHGLVVWIRPFLERRLECEEFAAT